MTRFRSLLAQRHLAILLCLAALALKLLIPGGYMLSADHGRLAITVCSGVASRPIATAVMHGAMKHHAPQQHHGAVELPCAFAGLSHPALGTVDPILLVAAIAFVRAIGRTPAPRPMPARATHLRPPLRGPPAAA